MGNKDRLTKVAQAKFESLGNISQILGYLEHQMDFTSKLVLDLTELIEPEKISPEMKIRVDAIKSLMEESSVDFANLNSPMENYKAPKTVELKSRMRKLQVAYLEALVRDNEL